MSVPQASSKACEGVDASFKISLPVPLTGFYSVE
jgi:hypothetical protein